MNTRFLSGKFFLSILYLVFCALILTYMNGLITNNPITSDAEQNLTMTYHFYKSGVLSNDQADAVSPTPSNYREPVPPIVSAFGMYLHPGISQATSFQSMENGEHTRMIKQVNLFWILLLLTGVGYLTYIVSRNKYLQFLSFFLVVTYFIRFGNHFDSLRTELPAAVFIIWLTCVLVLMVKRRTMPLYITGGLLLGLLILTKGVFLYLSVIILLFVFFLNVDKSRYLKFALFAFGTLLVVAPWLIRNHGIYQEFSLTQRGGAVLHLRAVHNQMTGEEVIGAINYWGPEIYKDIVRKTPLGADEGDFEVAGRYQRINMDHAIDTLAVDMGSPDMAISFYSKSRAKINRLQEVLGSYGKEGARHDVYELMEANSKQMILEHPVKHTALSFLYLWRGIWCFPNSTLPLLNDTLQNYIHNSINFIAYISLFVFLIFGLLKRNEMFVALTIVPVSMLLIHALLTENLARFSEPVIPSMIVGFSLLVYLVKEKTEKKLSA